MYILYKSAESENMKIKLILYIVHTILYLTMYICVLCNTVVQKGKYENKSEMNKYKSGDSKNLNKMNRC